jgi:hypothetical protein
MRARRWLLSLGMAVVTAGCGTQGGDDTAVSGGPAVVGEPGSEAGDTLSVGETVGFSMYTHCGVESTRINGRVWNAVEPLYATPDRLGPPAGWGDPEQEGELTLEAPDRAVFAALGQRVVLMPSESGQPLRPCD